VRPQVDRATRFVVLVGDLLLRLLLVAFLGFVLFRLIPGNPVTQVTQGRATTPAQLEAIRHQLHLDEPLPLQFVRYLTDLLHGDLGRSLRYQRPVLDLIGERLGPTLLLTGTATVLSIVLGCATGVLAGWRTDSRFDRWSTSTALALWATPAFWLGLILLVGLGAGAGPLPALFPTSGMRSFDRPPGTLRTIVDVGHHLVLPTLTLVAVQAGQYHQMMRASLRSERSEGYLRLARAKGLSEQAVRRHALPNAILPTATLALLNLGYLVSGAVAVETVYSWPGLGYLTFQALQIHDLPLLQGTFLFFSAAVIIANAGADLLRARWDPRSH
jgi:peptide/nickel transport system permease protein